MTFRKIEDNVLKVNVEDLEEFHLANYDDGEILRKITFNENDFKDVLHTIKARQGQYKLRKALLQNYRSKCALCSINDPKLLITSHIKRWSTATADERNDTNNSIMLCKLHDGLFEHGYISLTDDYQVLYSQNFDFKGQRISTNLSFTLPKEDYPSNIFLREHRLMHGYE
ncbi:HNH endonuclease [Peribacillus glennii]|uniref:HNH endonuclease n=1 Tax=Peribacillus glennii TaxID=2303991 RepID=UPI0013149E43|nr:HNH endonuclease signature motif containing protein [Peribacillus glennii]